MHIRTSLCARLTDFFSLTICSFTTFGRAGGGLSFSDHKWLEWVLHGFGLDGLANFFFCRDKHGRHFIPFDRKKPPPWINFGPTGNDDKRE
jgi:hypothetical protein